MGDDTQRHSNKEWDEVYARAEKFYAENGKEMNGLDEFGKAANFALAERDAATKEATEQAERREITAIREGYKAEICGKCDTVLLAHKHFIRCSDSACPMKDGKGSILEQLLGAGPLSPEEK